MSLLLDAAEAGGSLFADVSWVAVMAVASPLCSAASWASSPARRLNDQACAGW